MAAGTKCANGVLGHFQNHFGTHVDFGPSLMTTAIFAEYIQTGSTIDINGCIRTYFCMYIIVPHFQPIREPWFFNFLLACCNDLSCGGSVQCQFPKWWIRIIDAHVNTYIYLLKIQ